MFLDVVTIAQLLNQQTTNPQETSYPQETLETTNPQEILITTMSGDDYTKMDETSTCIIIR